MSDIFVSYKAEDRRRIKPLVDALQAEGFSVWWDEQIGGGAAWRQAIETELNAAKCVLVIWSTRSVGPDGTFVQDEATRAQQRHVYVPVLIDKVHLPLGFGETQALPLTGWKGDRSDARFEAVLAAVRRNVGGKRRATAAPAPTSHAGRGLDRRTMIAGGTVAAVVAGAGAWAFFKPSAAGAASDSIAVLPFENLSGDPTQAYFSDGVAEEIRSALARVAGLKVVGRTSSEAVRNDDAQTAARKLDVASILTGTVRQSPSTIRISAELVDGHSGIDKWSQDYDRSPGDAIKIQVDIAENVASALSTALGQAARAAISIGGTGNAAAQKLFLKAKSQLRSDDSENSLRSSIGLLDSATDLDPKFADAYATKSRALSDLNGYFTAPGSRFEPGFVQAAAVAQQAILLAPNLPSGHMALGYVRLAQLDLAASATEYEKGHALAGGSADDLLDYATFLWIIGRFDQSLDVARQVQSTDPLNPSGYSMEASCQRSAGRFAQAEAAFRKSLALRPKSLLDRGFYGATLDLDGKQDEALAQLQQLPADYMFRLVVESILFAHQGKRAASDAALQRLRQLNGEAANYQYADIHAQRGEIDQAFASLDRAWSFRDPGLAYMKTDVWLRPLRSDPRYVELIRKMNFPTA